MALVIEGEERIAAPLQKVWEALNDPEVLKATIPGCQSLEMKSPTEMAATVVLKIGPKTELYIRRGMPMPASETERHTVGTFGNAPCTFAASGACSWNAVRKIRLPPLGMASTAFIARLTMTWRNSNAST